MTSPSSYRYFFLAIAFLFFDLVQAQPTLPTCGTTDSVTARNLIERSKISDLTRARVAKGEKLEYRLALDINYSTYLLYNKNKELITRTAYQFIEDASVIFERDVNVKLTVASILIWDKPEPYQLVSDGDYFSNVYTYWSQNRFEERDAVVSLSVRGGWFYGGFRMCSSNFPDPGNPSLPVDLFCHELGHTLGSPHTHNCSWPGGPIDYCELLESGSSDCRSDYREYVNGSLMSYCRSVLSFHPYCQNLMRDYSEGKVNSTFKLNALDMKPTLSGQLVLKDINPLEASNNPAFEWHAPIESEYFRFQISRNRNFTELVEDTIVKQSFFRSPGLSGGAYFARYNAGNPSATSDWSQVVPFAVPPFSSVSMPPLLLRVLPLNDGTVVGSFRKYDGIDYCQFELRDYYNPNQVFINELKITDKKIQDFQFSVGFNLYRKLNIRYRVAMGGKWSAWSEFTYFGDAWNSEVWKMTNLTNTSSSPIIALSSNQPSLHNGLFQSIEISPEATFSTKVFKDSTSVNQLNDWFTNKSIFAPRLEENKSYFVRTRVNWAPGSYSKWNTYKLQTGQLDKRFEFMGRVSPNLSSTNSTYMEFSQCKFYKTANKLYVQTGYQGYYSTNDLKTWQTHTTSTTKGASPNDIAMFAASDDGKRYMLDRNFGMVKFSTNGTYEYHYAPDKNFYVPDKTPGLITKTDGIFFTTEGKGVVNFKDGVWKFYGQSVLQSDRAFFLKADSEGRPWVVMDGGMVWSYRNERWSYEFSFSLWQTLKGISFDQNDNLYLYGAFGMARVNKGERNPEFIASVNGMPIRKIVFDKYGQIWLASYKNPDGQSFQNFALIKLKGQKMSVYLDGLNFLKEQFDIEIFNDKLLIMTSGGELHSFDETLIQSFEPMPNYCTGNELIVGLNSNSTFAGNNKFSFQLTHTESGKIVSLETVVRDGNKLKTVIPADFQSGTYQLRISTTNPEIQSNISTTFQISAPILPVITKAEVNRFRTRLVVNGQDILTYQWRLNGVDILQETSANLNVYESGAYSVVVTNKAGCPSLSQEIKIALDEPGEVTLLQNYPNPVMLATEIAFYLPEAMDVSLNLFNEKGEYLDQLQRGKISKGWHIHTIDASNRAPGVYLYKLVAAKTVKSLKMVKL